MQRGLPVHVFGLANLWSNANELIDDLDGTGWIFCQHASKEGLVLALVLWVELILTGSVQRRAAINITMKQTCLRDFRKQATKAGQRQLPRIRTPLVLFKSVHIASQQISSSAKRPVFVEWSVAHSNLKRWNVQSHQHFLLQHPVDFLRTRVFVFAQIVQDSFAKCVHGRQGVVLAFKRHNFDSAGAWSPSRHRKFGTFSPFWCLVHLICEGEQSFKQDHSAARVAG